MRNAILVSCLALTALTAGCFENVTVITVNPDGSGKFVLDSLAVPPPNFGGPDAKAPDPKEIAKQTVTSMVEKSKGVDAWSDVTAEVTNEGKIHMKATAYFPDITKMEVEAAGKSNVKWAKNAAGGMTLEMVMETKKPDKAVDKPKAMTDEEVAEQVKKVKMQWQQTSPMMSSFLAKMKMDTTYVLPGKLGEVEGFTKTEKGVQVLVEGKKMLEAMDKLYADDKLLTELVKAGKDPVKDGPGDKALMEAMFGKGVTAFKASVSGDLKPQFDYKAEMEKAKAGQADMMKKFATEATEAPKATPASPGPGK